MCYYLPFFTDGKTRAQRGKASCLMSTRLSAGSLTPESSIGSSFGCYVPGTEGFHGGQENMIPDCKELSIHLSVAFRPCTLFLVPAVLSLQYSLSLVDFSLPYRLRAGITFSSCSLLLGKYLEGISQMLMSRGSVT